MIFEIHIGWWWAIAALFFLYLWVAGTYLTRSRGRSIGIWGIVLVGVLSIPMPLSILGNANKEDPIWILGMFGGLTLWMFGLSIRKALC